MDLLAALTVTPAIALLAALGAGPHGPGAARRRSTGLVPLLHDGRDLPGVEAELGEGADDNLIETLAGVCVRRFCQTPLG